MRTITLETAICALTMLSLSSTMTLADWTGGYVGGSLGFLAEGEATAEFEGQELSAEIEVDTILGIFGGYQVQRGDLVFGGELAISAADDFEATNQDGETSVADFTLIDLKARAGYDLGDALVYGTAGLSQINISGGDVADDQDDTAEGFNFGIGADYQVSEQITLGAEYLARRVVFEDEVDTDVTADTFSFRAAFRF
ncbi:porin family protein [Cognatiyoonia sp. IB215182]|uniref:porin family protein n=1 Tax=Cognatiyoonia sp. IB215182 TaxID=3097353 RepID=UPI002A1229D7|nr:porin family protein [Cognatiyoonia sp. IB215182]MDX8352121.1 porin family protein [Cognatiyoonia sp. IB215182]